MAKLKLLAAKIQPKQLKKALVEAAPKSRSKDVVLEKPVKKASKVTEPVEEEAPAVFTPRKSGRGKIPEYFTSKEFLDLSKQLDKVEGKVKCNSVYMETKGFIEYPISTGILTYDLKLGGGLAGGRVHVEYGGERSAKTTRATTLLGNCVVDSIFPSYYDAETAISPSYMDKILKNSCGFTLQQLQGVLNEKGEWEEPPLIRYYAENMGRKFFEIMHETLMLLPDIYKDRHNNYFKVYPKRGGGEEYVECDGYPQMLFL